MSKHAAYASMTSASSFPAPNRVRACPNCSPGRPRSYSSEDSHKTPILLEPESTTLPGPQSPPDPRKHRSVSNTFTLPFDTHRSPKQSLSRKFSLNEGSPPPPSTSIQRRSSLPPPSRSHHRRPTSTSNSVPTTPLVTIPLRPCCPDCFSATESATLQGDDWIENFSRPTRRRRSVSSDNRPCPPHLLATTSGATIQWSTSPSSSTFPSVAVDEVDNTPGHTDDVRSGSGGQGIKQVRTGLDRVSVRDPEDDVLPPLLTRHKPWLPPIPSNNPSVEDVSPDRAVGEEVDSSPESSGSLSSSPMLPTPSSSVILTPTSSPPVSPARGRESSPSMPSMPGSFRVTKRGVLRAGSDILKGVGAIGGSPIL